MTTLPTSPVSGGSPRVLAVICSALALVLPLVTVVGLLGDWPTSFLGAVAAALPPATLQSLAGGGPLRLWMAALLSLLPVLLMAVALLRAAACLRAFARGRYFSREPVTALRAFAAWALAAGLAGVAVPVAVVLVLTVGGPGPGTLALSLGSQQLFLILFAAVAWQIAAVLARAVALAEDHAQIV